MRGRESELVVSDDSFCHLAEVISKITIPQVNVRKEVVNVGVDDMTAEEMCELVDSA
jgi:hypothetical protein